jgi:hypothetical protein
MYGANEKLYKILIEQLVKFRDRRENNGKLDLNK